MPRRGESLWIGCGLAVLLLASLATLGRLSRAYLVELVLPTLLASVVAMSLGLALAIAWQRRRRRGEGTSSLVEALTACALCWCAFAGAVWVLTAHRPSQLLRLSWPIEVTDSGDWIIALGWGPLDWFTWGYRYVPVYAVATSSDEWLHIGMVPTATHTPGRASVALDVEGERLFWLRPTASSLTPWVKLLSHTISGGWSAELLARDWPCWLMTADLSGSRPRVKNTGVLLPRLEAHIEIAPGGEQVAVLDRRVARFVDWRTGRSWRAAVSDGFRVTAQGPRFHEDGSLVLFRKQSYPAARVEVRALDPRREEIRVIREADFAGFTHVEVLAIDDDLESAAVLVEYSERLHGDRFLARWRIDIVGLGDPRADRELAADEGWSLFGDASAVFLSDGTLALSVAERDGCAIWIYSRSGERLASFSCTGTELLRLVGEMEPGVLLAAAYPRAWLLELETGSWSLFDEGSWPQSVVRGSALLVGDRSVALKGVSGETRTLLRVDGSRQGTTRPPA